MPPIFLFNQSPMEQVSLKKNQITLERRGAPSPKPRGEAEDPAKTAAITITCIKNKEKTTFTINRFTLMTIWGSTVI